MPKVSIIVPVYNAECYLRKCLDSIINQDFEDWELLLIDDGSTDSSLLICQEYTNSDNRAVVFHKENGGVSSARNFCMLKAKGEWIAFVDADDWLEQDYLTNMLQYDKSDMVIEGYKNEKNIEFKISDSNVTLETKDIDFSEKKNNQIFYFPWRRLYRRDIIIENRLFFNERIRMSEDTCFTIHYLTYCGKITLSSACNYIYRTGTGEKKYLLKYDEFKLHCEELGKMILLYFVTTGTKLDTLEKMIMPVFFYCYKDYLNTVTQYADYVDNTKNWKRLDVENFVNRYFYDTGIVKRMFYINMLIYPLLGYVVIMLRKMFK